MEWKQEKRDLMQLWVLILTIVPVPVVRLYNLGVTITVIIAVSDIMAISGEGSSTAAPGPMSLAG